MERELIITVHKDSPGKEQLIFELKSVKSMFSFIESFDTFKTCNEVFDIIKGRRIRNRFSLKRIFKNGTVSKPHQYIINLN